MILPRPSKIKFEDVPVPGSASFALREFRWPRFPLNWHYHPEIELTLIVKGQGLRLVGDSIQDFADGDLCLLGSNIPHCWTSPANAEGGVCSLVLQFRVEAWGPQFWKMPEMLAISGLLDRAGRGVQVQGATRRLAARRFQEMTDHPPGSWQRFQALLGILGMLAESSELTPLTTAGYKSAPDQPGNEKLGRVLKFVHEHLNDDLSQHAAAASLGMSPAAFSQFFRRTMGRTFVDFINDLRIRQASRALLESDQSITEIAFAAGFNNLSHFHAQFRRLRGTTPRAYRESAAEVAQEDRQAEQWQGRFR